MMNFTLAIVFFVLGSVVMLVSNIACYRIGYQNGKSGQMAKLHQWMDEMAAKLKAKNDEMEARAKEAAGLGASGDSRVVSDADRVSGEVFKRIFGYDKPAGPNG